MKRRNTVLVCFLAATAFVGFVTYGLSAPAKTIGPQLAPFEFHREAADSPEAAAKALFRGIANESPKHFVQHLLLGVCDNSIDTLQKFAECLHRTEFSHEKDSFTFYDLRELRRSISFKNPVREIAFERFDSEDPKVLDLRFQMVSTYYGETFAFVDVAGAGRDGLEYQTRIVVAEVNGGWYAMPRCRSARSFYEIADAMSTSVIENKTVK